MVLAGQQGTLEALQAENLRLLEQLSAQNAELERLRFALSATGDAIWDTDLTTGWVKHNLRWCELLGFTDVMLEHEVSVYFNLIHPDDLAEVSARVEAAFQRDIKYEAEYRLRHADGHYIWVYDHGQVVQRAPDGTPQRMIGAFADISEQKIAREALIESERRLLTAQEAAQLGVWEADLLNGKNYFSPECERLYDLPPGSLKSEADWRACLLPEDLPLIDAHWATSIANAQMFEQEFRVRLPSGKIRWLLSKGRAQLEDGQIKLMSGINLDITRQKQNEEALRLQEDVLTHMSQGVSLVSPAGILVYTNPRFDELFGYARGELSGQHVSVCNALSLANPLVTANEILESLQTNKFWSGEVLNRRKDGSEFWSTSNITVFKHYVHGEVWLGVISDITEIKKLQLERDAAHDALESLSRHIQDDMERLRRDLAHEVHDEIGALLTGVRMQLEAIPKKILSPELKDAVSPVISLVNEAALSTRRLCTRLRPPMLDDLGLIETCRWYLADWSKNMGIEVEGHWGELPEELPQSMTTDLFRILQELLTNVVRHASGTKVSVRLSRENERIFLRVRDNGQGFDWPGAAAFGLTGIRERARRHSGAMHVESTPSGTLVEIQVVFKG